MINKNGLSHRDISKLESEVAVYIKNNYYFHANNGMTQFMYHGLHYGKDSAIYLSIPHVLRAFIYQKDLAWERGLQKIGKKYGVVLKLPEFLYIKKENLSS